MKFVSAIPVLLTLVALGCQSAQPVVRAQSPGMPNTQMMPAPQTYPPGVTYPPSSAPVVAGTPTEYGGPIIGSAPGYGQFAKSHAHHRDFALMPGVRDHNFGFEGGYYAGTEGYYTPNIGRVYDGHGDGTAAGGSAGGCPHCQQGQACPQGGCQHCGFGCKPLPHHYHTYRHNWPQNMVYPPNVLPAGMVQYPYYTNRGPTDFFMK